MITLESLLKEIEQQNIPTWSRKGQFVFNYMDEHYGIARIVQFKDGVDCFYDDAKIKEFLEHCLKYLNMSGVYIIDNNQIINIVDITNEAHIESFVIKDCKIYKYINSVSLETLSHILKNAFKLNHVNWLLISDLYEKYKNSDSKLEIINEIKDLLNEKKY